MLSPASSSPEISAIGEYIFKFYDDKYVTPVLANYVNNLGVDRVVALVEQSEACVRYVDAFASYFSGEILKYNFATNEKDFSILAKQVASKITSSDFLLFP
jgi:ABC-type branched-subunit amino acid transport system substrate-binding protein